MPTRTTFPVVRASEDGTALLFECPDCGASHRLPFPVSVTVAAYRGNAFNREHRRCAVNPPAPSTRSAARWGRVYETLQAPLNRDEDTE